MLICTWQELDDPTFCGPSTNWLVQLLNGLKHVTDVWPDSCPTLITPVTTANVVMWVTRHSTSDFAGDLEDSKSTSGEYFVHLEVEHSSLQTGCVSNRLRYLTAPLNLKSYLWEAGLRMEVFLRQIFGTLLYRYYSHPKTNKKTFFQSFWQRKRDTQSPSNQRQIKESIQQFLATGT